MKKTCGVCGAPVQMTTIDKSGEFTPLKVSVRGMPAAKCTHGHAAPVEQEFMLWLIHELKDREGALPAGNEQRMLLFKKYLCSCGKELAAKSERRQGFPLELVYEGTAPFRVALEMPVYKCTGCGKEQLRSHKAIQSITSQAIAAFNDAAGFPHSG